MLSSFRPSVPHQAGGAPSSSDRTAVRLHVPIQVSTSLGDNMSCFAWDSPSFHLKVQPQYEHLEHALLVPKVFFRWAINYTIALVIDHFPENLGKASSSQRSQHPPSPKLVLFLLSDGGQLS